MKQGLPESRGTRLRMRARNTIRLKRVLFIAGSSILFIVMGAFLFFNIGISKKTYAAVSGDYRNIISGSWNNLAIWEKYNGTIWVAAISSPTSANGTITIQSGTTVTLPINVTVDQLVIASGGALSVSANILTISNGVGIDLDNSGVVTLSGTGKITINAGAILAVENGGTYNYDGGTQTLTAGWDIKNGGTYVHNVNGINIPVATWGASSTLKITGQTTADINGLTQNFGNLIYNCPLQTGVIEFRDQLGSIQGDFNVISTGTGSIYLQRVSLATPVVVYGNYNQTGGTVYMTKGSAYTESVMGNFNLSGGTYILVERYGAPILNIYGNLNLTGGILNHSTYLSNLAGEGIGTANLFGDYIRSGGSHTETATLTGRGEFNFAKSGTQNFIVSGGSISNTVNFTVNNGAILNMADYVITGGGSFTLSSGGGLILGNVNGITSSSATGNVQVTGTRDFNIGGDYTYEGLSSQVTGNGLPATVHNLTVNNSNNLTMTNSSSATNKITFQNGKIITNANELGTTNTSVSAIANYSSSRYVIGNLRRSVIATGSYDYPLGTSANYEIANVNYSGMTGITDLLGSFTNAQPIEPAYPLSGLTVNGTLITDILNYGYWTLTPSTPMTGGTYTVTLKEIGHTNSSANPLEYCVLKRDDINSSWQSLGNHTNATQSEVGGVATAARSELSSFSHFAIGKGNGPLPVTLLYFKAKAIVNTVVCSWETMTEVNNDYFTLERSRDGHEFIEVSRIHGAGYTSNAHKYNYTDLNPFTGVSYYRLRQTDFDGQTKVSQTITVTQGGRSTSPVSLKVSPNPFNDAVAVDFQSAESGSAIIVVTTMNGKVIYKKEVLVDEGFNSIPVIIPATVAPGTYVLTVINDALDLKPVKIIKRNN